MIELLVELRQEKQTLVARGQTEALEFVEALAQVG
jgi:hypothetical protein